MEHHAPHKAAAFEGYYSKFDLPEGAKLALVVCHIPNAEQKGSMVSLTYVPMGSERPFQKVLWVDRLDMVPSLKDASFSVNIPEIGHVRWNADSSSEYELEHDSFTFRAKTTSSTPWSSNTNTPEGLLVNLPLPLHWHVQSLSSKCSFQLTLPHYNEGGLNASGTATVHEEKNWAKSFPKGHMWLQARQGESSFCCAGGQILGMEAFLVGYRNATLEVDFRPPWALRIAGFNPLMSFETNWAQRTFGLTVSGFRQKLEVEASAPRGTFFSLCSPFREGHRENFLAQSFRANISVRLYSRNWFIGSWRRVASNEFTDASLEFGGVYYPPAGSDQTHH